MDRLYSSSLYHNQLVRITTNNLTRYSRSLTRLLLKDDTRLNSSLLSRNLRLLTQGLHKRRTLRGLSLLNRIINAILINTNLSKRLRHLTHLLSRALSRTISIFLNRVTTLVSLSVLRLNLGLTGSKRTGLILNLRNHSRFLLRLFINRLRVLSGDVNNAHTDATP